MAANPATRRFTWGGLLVAVLVALLVWWGQTGSEDGDWTAPGDDGSHRTASASPSASQSLRDDPGPSSAEPTGTDPESELEWIERSALPPEAHDTLALIEAGGPYPHPQDDGTFGNFEGVLPDRPRGYYREYTVETPGLGHRGAKRIVTGDEGELYWTEDHYESFARIAP